jgi:hypothetical protein
MFWLENGDITQAIWTPNSGTTSVNASATIMPLGAGAFRTSTTGNTRGAQAVDMQRSRTAATEVASGDFSVISGGQDNTASGLRAVIGGGGSNTASGTNSGVFSGQNNQASLAETFVGGGTFNIATGLVNFIGGGNGNGTVGAYAGIAAGQNNSTTADYAFIGGGQSNTAGNNAAVAGGQENNASAQWSFIGGGTTNIVSAASTASTITAGQSNQVVNATHASIGGGQSNVLDANYSATPGGLGLIVDVASEAACAVGRYNMPGPLGGGYRMFMVGNGDGTPGGNMNLFSVSTDGNSHTAGMFVPGGADYAEYFESEDKEKYPVGTSVVFVGEERKIRVAKKGEVPFGVISKKPSVAGNGAEEHWHGKFIEVEVERDIFEVVTVEKTLIVEEEIERDGKIYLERGERIVKEPVMDEIDVMRGEVVVEKRQVPRKKKIGTRREKRFQLNPEYDPTKEYIPRSQRPEWNLVGILGVLEVLKSSPKAKYWKKIGEVDEERDLYFVH